MKSPFYIYSSNHFSITLNYHFQLFSTIVSNHSKSPSQSFYNSFTSVQPFNKSLPILLRFIYICSTNHFQLFYKSLSIVQQFIPIIQQITSNPSTNHFQSFYNSLSIIQQIIPNHSINYFQSFKMLFPIVLYSFPIVRKSFVYI